MLNRTLLLARVVLVASIAGLGASALWHGPAWLVIVLCLACLACLPWSLRNPAALSDSGLAPLTAAALELEEITRVRPDHLNTDTSPWGTLNDSTRRIRAAAARLALDVGTASARQQTVDSLLESVDEPILATDGGGLVIVCNAAAQALLGLSADRLVGRPIEEAFTQPDFARLIGSALQGRVSREEVRVPTADGPRIWEVSASRYGPDAGLDSRAVVLTLHDATDRSRAVQVKTDFVANASHELRTPISAIRVAVETLETLSPSDKAMYPKLIAMLGNHTHRLEELVRDLLDLSKLESTESSLHPETFTGSDIASELASSFRGACVDKRVTLRFALSADLQTMRTDRSLLMLILNNLVDNACKFAFEETEVLVAGMPLPGGRGVRFEVSDKGIGIPLGQQQRIFERFFQVDAARTGGSKRGTGLGLSIVKHAVRRLGGTIRVNSVWQQGTTMTVDLPNLSVNREIGPGESPHLPSP